MGIQLMLPLISDLMFGLRNASDYMALTPRKPVAEAIPALPLKAARLVEVDAPLYKVSISEKGAVF